MHHVPRTLVGLPADAVVAIMPTGAEVESVPWVCRLLERWVVNAGRRVVSADSPPATLTINVGSDMPLEAAVALRTPYIAVCVGPVEDDPVPATQVFYARAAALWVQDLPQWSWLRAAPFVLPCIPCAVVPLQVPLFAHREPNPDPDPDFDRPPYVVCTAVASSALTPAEKEAMRGARVCVAAPVEQPATYRVGVVHWLNSEPIEEEVAVERCPMAPFGTWFTEQPLQEGELVVDNWDGEAFWGPPPMPVARAEAWAGAMTLCLSMIVKNEAPIIEGTLRMLAAAFPQLVTFVIVDTGSTDDTRAIVARTMGSLGLTGHLLRRPWRDFGTNRTELLRAAHALAPTTHLLLWDADDVVVLPPGVAHVPLPPAPHTASQYSYMLETGTHCAKPIHVFRPVLISTARRWRYVGVLHEYLELDEPAGADPCVTHTVVQAGLKFLGRSAGARARAGDKLVRDAEVLERAVAEEQPGSGLWCRYLFYLGNTYRDNNDGPNAIRVYRQLTTDPRATTGWAQEKYVACLRLGVLLLHSGDPAGAVLAWLQACSIDATRVDAVFELVNLFTLRNEFRVAYAMSTLGRAPRPGDVGHLFLIHTAAAFDLPYVMIIVCQRTGRVEEACAQFGTIFAHGHVPASDFYLNNLFGNLRFVPGVDPEAAAAYAATVRAARPEYEPAPEAVEGLATLHITFPGPEN